jgi:hypothetical protein
VLAYDAKARQWFTASFHFSDVESKTGSWLINGEVVNAADVMHWVPLPPNLARRSPPPWGVR